MMKAEPARRNMMAEQYRGRINTAVDYIEKNLKHSFSLDVFPSIIFTVFSIPLREKAFFSLSSGYGWRRRQRFC